MSKTIYFKNLTIQPLKIALTESEEPILYKVYGLYDLIDDSDSSYVYLYASELLDVLKIEDRAALKLLLDII